MSSGCLQEFNDFIAKALIKDPHKRPTCDELLKHPFINCTLDSKPIRDLLLEYKAEVVEEELTDDDPEVRYVDVIVGGRSSLYFYRVVTNISSNVAVLISAHFICCFITVYQIFYLIPKWSVLIKFYRYVC